MLFTKKRFYMQKSSFVILSVAKNLVRFAYRFYKILRYAQNDKKDKFVHIVRSQKRTDKQERLYIQKMIKRIAANTQAEGLQRDNICRGDIAQAYVGAYQLNKPNLLCFLRGFPNNGFFGDLG
jgi:hypothetical protein